MKRTIKSFQQLHRVTWLHTFKYFAVCVTSEFSHNLSINTTNKYLYSQHFPEVQEIQKLAEVLLSFLLMLDRVSRHSSVS